jgi:polyhydroxyalkanoate synthesis regulator phasin
VKKFGAKANKFAIKADQLVEELAKKPKRSYQEANKFVEKAVQFAQKVEKPSDETLKQFRKTAREAVYTWCVQAKTVVAVVKFEKLDGNILYEARYTNCGEKQKHAEDFFQEDIENGRLGEKVKANPNGTITLYLTYQPCNKSTSIKGIANTLADKTCCKTLTTIVNEILLPEIKLCVKAANTCRLSLTKEKDSDDETLRNNAVDGIKMLMQAGVDVSGMTKDDWDYLLAMTNPDVPRNYHKRRKDLDKSVQKTFTDIKAQIKKPKKQSSSKKS